ncbi:MAG TPA: magnesium and cobalt transporter CorA [Candidatus Dorea intestinavium]|nr:magnesium and cobalt transporter CorA [Candidatus Dorea intestinavium]
MSDAIKIMTKEDFLLNIPKSNKERRRLDLSLRNTDNCKVELLPNSLVGNFLIPDKKNLTENEALMGFYVTKDEIILIGEKFENRKQFIKYEEEVSQEGRAPIRVLFDLMEFIIKDDTLFLQNYELRLSDIEEELINRETKEFDKKILKVRKELLALQSYYQQLTDMADTIVEDDYNMVDENQERLYNIYAKKTDRLFDHVNRLKEYTMQLSELHQSQIDIRQNEIMKVLTVVTTLVMPLTLITGWYGMNFRRMPELESDYGYVVIIVISIIVLLVEVWYFKIKDWFN